MSGEAVTMKIVKYGLTLFLMHINLESVNQISLD